MNKTVTKLVEMESNGLVNGYLIRRDDSDFCLARNEKELRDKFDGCYWFGDRNNASKGGKISNPIFEEYFNCFLKNNFVIMPKAKFTLKQVEIPLWDGKEQGYYFENDILHDIYEPYRFHPSGEYIY